MPTLATAIAALSPEQRTALSRALATGVVAELERLKEEGACLSETQDSGYVGSAKNSSASGL